MHKLYCFLGTIVLISNDTMAAPEAGSKLEHISLFQVFIPLLIVLVVIFAFAWLAKKFGRKLPLLNSDMKIRSVAAISNSAKLVLININGNDILIGVTNQSINLIKDFKYQASLDSNEETINTELKEKFATFMKPEATSAEKANAEKNESS